MKRPVVALVCALSLLSACRQETPKEQFPDAPIILISIDTLRADRLPAYGYKGVETPAIDALRRDAVLFTRAYSHCPMTLPSHVSMLTGLIPPHHGVRNNLGYLFDPTAHPTLPQLLKTRGYVTGAAVASYVLRGDTGLRGAFDFYDDSIPAISGEALGSHQRSGGEVVAAANRWIESNRGAPYFFMLHLYEPHAPYSAPEPFRSRYRDAYDAEVATSDRIVGEFLAALKRSGDYDRATIILTSDHGEGLWDHGEDQHGILLYREAIEVPFIVKLPGAKHAGRTIASVAQLADIAPTLLELSGVESSAKLDGRSLVPVLEGKSGGDGAVYSETFYPRIHLGWSELRSLVRGNDHYIQAPRAELYDIVRDPSEKADRAASDRRVAAALRKELEQIDSAAPAVGVIDPEVAKKLSALGYVGSAQQESSGPLRNPKDHLGELTDLRNGFALAEKSKFDEAARVLRALIASNPSMLDAWDKLGEVLMAAGRYDEAAEVFDGAIRRFPNVSSNLLLSRALVHLQQGNVEKAEEAARAAIGDNEPKAREILARGALMRRDFATAERELQAALRRNPEQPSLMLFRAEIQRDRGDLNAALATVKETEQVAKRHAVDRVFRLEFLRGDILARLDRPEEAIVAYKREIALFPRHAQAYANLALIYLIMERPREAYATLDAMLRAVPTPRARELAVRTLDVVGDSAAAARYRR